jgi:hypothetical protein
LLRDFCGQYRQEVSVLVSALKERVTADLLTSRNSMPSAILLARLTKRLQDDLGLTQEAARWAVESWGLALGVISEAELALVDSSSPPQVSPQYRQENINQIPVTSSPPQVAPQYRQENVNQISVTSSPPQRTEISLKSERGIDYTKLRDLLAAGKWWKADDETARVMLQASRRAVWIDIDNFPCEDLRTINELWLHYSNGKFGFSVQKKIYQSLGGTNKYNAKVWQKFCQRIGWGILRPFGLVYSINAPTGHLPFVSAYSCYNLPLILYILGWLSWVFLVGIAVILQSGILLFFSLFIPVSLIIVVASGAFASGFSGISSLADRLSTCNIK